MTDDPTPASLVRWANGRFQSYLPDEQVSQAVGGGESPPKGARPLRPTEPAVYNPDDLMQAAGTVGKLIDWISASAIYPNRPLALGAALVTVGTVAGQRVAGPTHGSTHLYVVGIGGSGSGKQHGIDCVNEALNAIGAQDRIGPGDFRSSVGLVNSLKKQSVFCSCIDEYGLVLQRIGHKGAGGYESDVVNILQQLWGHNWTYFNSPAAAREKSERIFAPAFSILGLSVPEHFYGAVRLTQIAGGLLNRHLIIRGEDRPPLQKRADGSWKVPAVLKQRLQALYQPRPKPATAATAEEAFKAAEDTFEPMVTMGWGSRAAEQIWGELVATLREEPDELRRNLFARVPEMTVRIATIVAYGRFSPTVDELDMLWARDWALKSAQTMHEGVLKYTVDPQDFAGLCQKILDLAAEGGGWISRRDLKRRCTTLIAKGSDLDFAIKHLVEAERIRELERQPGSKGGRPSKGYELCA